MLVHPDRGAWFEHDAGVQAGVPLVLPFLEKVDNLDRSLTAAHVLAEFAFHLVGFADHSCTSLFRRHGGGPDSPAGLTLL
jgi:hypothetical protein